MDKRGVKKALSVFAGGIAGALLNLGTMLFVQKVLHAPLFMDTLFTVTCTFLGGLPWGLSTAVLTHLITNPLMATPLPGYLYTLCNIAAAILTAFFMRLFPEECTVVSKVKQPRGAGLSERITVLFILSLAMCFLISILGGIISTIIEVFFSSWESYSAKIFIFQRMLVRKGLPLFLVEILARVPINIVDRLLSVFAGFGFALGVCRALPILIKKDGKNAVFDVFLPCKLRK